jgi:NitT/TauT family transport system substrate-binding protein
VNLSALQGGTTAIQALITNTVDATTNEYIHTIAAQREGKHIQAIEVFSYAPTYALVTTKRSFGADVSDLQDKNIGVVSLGGSTEDLVTYVFSTNHLDPKAAHLVAVGAGAQQTAAVKGGELDALIATEPTLTTTLDEGLVKPLVDFRDPAVIDKMFGGAAPFWSLLVSDSFTKDNPHTAQALVSATVRALKYIKEHTAAEVADHLPAEVFFPSGDRKLFEEILAAAAKSFSADGSMPDGGPQRIADYLKVAHPDEKLDGLDLDATYDTSFTAAAK